MDYKDAANLTTKLATSLYLYTSFSAKKVSKSHFCPQNTSYLSDD